LTLPEEVIETLQASHSDLGWAIVKLVEQTRGRGTRQSSPDAQLLEVGAGASLIVVNPTLLQDVPAVKMVPLSDNEAFLALAPGRGWPTSRSRSSIRWSASNRIRRSVWRPNGCATSFAPGGAIGG